MMDIKLFCFSCMEKLDDPNQICPACGHDNHVRTNAHDQLPNSVVGKRYLIGHALGRGGFGITYIGRDLMLNRKIAVKEFFPHNLVTRMTGASTIAAVDDERGELFARGKVDALQEAQIIARLGQIPHTVSVHDIFEANNSFYIVMEYIDGVTLRKYVEKSGGKLTPKEALDMLHPLFSTLSRVHQQGVIHRDISPDNIMVRNETDEVVLLDFGAARIVDEQEETLSINPVFRSGYAPLEQYIRRVRLTPRTDEYALCATLFFCITGEKPQDALERMHDEDHLTLPEDVAGQLEPCQVEALAKGLSIKAADRYETIDALGEALYDQSVHPKPEQKKAEKGEMGEDIPKKPWVQWFKKKTIIISLVASVVVGGILIGVLLWGEGAEPAANTDSTLAPFTAELTAAVPESTAAPTETPAETTSPEELFTLGYNYENGVGGVEQDYEKAVEYYQLAADQNNARAQVNLGWCYESGQGVKQDYGKAVEYYQLAADQNDVYAHANLGFCYENGLGVEQDYEKAAEYYQLAADQNDPYAQNSLGVLYWFGVGVEQDYKKAAEYYQLAADQNNALAQINLGVCYESGRGVEQNYEKAAEYYQLAADQNDPDAQYYLGECYELGRGVEKSFEQAVLYYKQGASNNQPSAQYRLGICYQYGHGVEQDLAEAEKYFALAGEEGKKGGAWDSDAEYEKIDIPVAASASIVFDCWPIEVYPTVYLTDFRYLQLFEDSPNPDLVNFLFFPLPDGALPVSFSSGEAECFIPDRNVSIRYSFESSASEKTFLYEKGVRNSLFLTAENGLEVYVDDSSYSANSVLKLAIQVNEPFVNIYTGYKCYLRISLQDFSGGGKDALLQVGKEDISRILNAAQIKQLDHFWSDGLYSSIVLKHYGDDRNTRVKIDTSELILTTVYNHLIWAELPWGNGYVTVICTIKDSSSKTIENCLNIEIWDYEPTMGVYDDILEKAYSYVTILD